jgi:hypothetical protein
MTLKDYLSDNIEIIKYTDEHIREQLLDKVQQIGYKKPEDAVLGNIRGRAYEYEDAIEVLKSNRPVYVIGENRKLIGVIESSGRDGFLKPISIRKQNTLIKDYMEKAKQAVQQMVSENKPLSQEGQKAARYYMAKVVCYERLLNDKKMGNGSLSQVIGDDEKKFQKAATMIYNDPVFEKLTDKISLEQLEDFMNNHGEKELNRQYIRESMVLKQDQPEVPSIQI